MTASVRTLDQGNNKEKDNRSLREKNETLGLALMDLTGSRRLRIMHTPISALTTTTVAGSTTSVPGS
jgi:phosphoenolpyruvate-protein kinase (PTS system EI component)